MTRAVERPAAPTQTPEENIAMSVPTAPAEAPGVEVAQAAPAPVGRRRRRKPFSWKVTLARLVLVVVWLGSWQLIATKWIDPFIFSRPSDIVSQLVTWFTDGTSQGSIWLQIRVTMQEAVIGFLIGSALGIVFGVLLGRSRFLADVCAPFIKGANAIPRIVLASLFVIWFGFGMESKIATAVVLVFFAVFFNAFQGAREVDKTLVDNARILGASRRQILTSIVLPSATTWILASLHTAFGFALIGAIVGEFTGADKGVGLLIAHSQGTFNSAGIYAAMIISTVLALAAELILTRVENRLLAWRPNSATTGAGA